MGDGNKLFHAFDFIRHVVVGVMLTMDGIILGPLL
jgi:hypothetical protein